MIMNDGNTTISELKEKVHQLCLRKGWGVDGVQDPQHVAMAMTVEMSELLEHFQWLNREDVEALMEGRDPERRALIAEEFADVMMYGLQLTRTLGRGDAQDRHRGSPTAKALRSTPLK